MNLSYWLSRHFRVRRGSGSDVGALIAVIGVALALLVLELSLAVSLGFKDEIRRKLAGFDAQVTVLPLYDPATGGVMPWLEATPELVSSIRNTLQDASVRLSIRQPGILKTDSDFHGIILHAHEALDPEEGFEFERSNIVSGRWPDFSSPHEKESIVLSRPVASQLGLKLGDKIYSNFFIDGDIRARRHTLVGIYESFFGEYDRNIAYVSPALLRSVASRDSLAAMRIDLRDIPFDDVESSASRLYSALEMATASGQLPGIYPVSDVERADAVYFNWLSLLDTNVIVIFILMLFVSGFTLVSSLFILILDRISEIGILRALGADGRMVSHVFVWMALRLTGLGMIIGNILGIGLILIQSLWHVVPLDPEMYYLAYVPVRMSWTGIILLNIGVLAASWILLVLPARLASRIDPAKTMQYE
ncbi:MAG: FtsX-like permease family protein [Muribaculaceae bacterium]|nr:FtsX-like permease family protein [Muribaculaceae bacterium]